MAPAPGFEPGSSARQAEMIGQATPREHEAGPEPFVYRLYQGKKLHAHIESESRISSFSIAKVFVTISFFHHSTHEYTNGFL